MYASKSFKKIKLNSHWTKSRQRRSCSGWRCSGGPGEARQRTRCLRTNTRIPADESASATAWTWPTRAFEWTRTSNYPTEISKLFIFSHKNVYNEKGSNFNVISNLESHENPLFWMAHLSRTWLRPSSRVNLIFAMLLLYRVCLLRMLMGDWRVPLHVEWDLYQSSGKRLSSIFK